MRRSLTHSRLRSFLGQATIEAVSTGELVDFWQVFPVAIALLLIIEGVLPFLVPARWRAMLKVAETLDDGVIRMIGLGSMLCGLALLFWVH